MSKFDVDKFIEEYKKMYDSLPDKAKSKEGKLKSKSKETVSNDKEMRKKIEAVLKDNQNNTACVSCPLNGKCRRINWKGDQTWIKVTGCSQHPDQKKFKGRSTTVTITDLTVSAAAQNNDSSYANARGGATASEGTFVSTLATYIYKTADSSVYTVVRGLLYFDTTSIPSNAILSAAKYSIYAGTVYSDNGNADNFNIVKGNTAPHSPAVAADFASSKYDYSTPLATLHRGTMSADAYNDFILSSPFAIIIKAGYTLGMMVYSDDPDNNTPAVADTIYGSAFTGSDSVTPPKLIVTYDLPADIPPRSPNKKQMVI